MILLGVNADHAATLRQARYRDETTTHGGFVEPDPGKTCLVGGGSRCGRHNHACAGTVDMCKWRAFSAIRKNANPFESEVSLLPRWWNWPLSLKPESVCLVPENRKEVTTEGGLDIVSNFGRSRDAVQAFTEAGIPTSMFIDPDRKQLEASAEIGSPWVELHTGSFARAWYDDTKREELNTLREGMEYGISLGLRVNAGHGINYDNVEGGEATRRYMNSILATALFPVP